MLVGGLVLVGLALYASLWNEGPAAASEDPAIAAPVLKQVRTLRGEPLKVGVEARTPPILVGVTHEWDVTVANARGEPAAGCQVVFDGTMPEHGHGLPTAPRVTGSPSPGRYRVEGVRFSMPGYWSLDVKAVCGGAELLASFDLRL